MILGMTGGGPVAVLLMSIIGDGALTSGAPVATGAYSFINELMAHVGRAVMLMSGVRATQYFTWGYQA